MASAPIAELPVIITGDFSDLSDSITGATSAAQDGAEQIAAAFQIPDAFGDLNEQALGVAESFKDVTPAADESMGALGEAASAAQEAGDAFSEASSNSGDLGSGLHEAGDAATQASENIESVGESAKESEGGLETMLEALGEFTGIALTFEALKEAATESVTAFGNEQSSAIALTAALQGNAGAANELIEQAKQMADFLGQTNEALITTTQRLINFGVPADDVSNALYAIGTAADASHKDFDTIASQFERMAAAGTLAARSLASSGFSIQDVGAAMGEADAPTTKITADFKNLGDVADRMNALASAALVKLPTLAEDASNSVNASWQRMKNATEDAFVSIGAQLNGFAGLATVVTDGLKLIASGLLGLTGDAKIVADILIGAFGFVASSLEGVAAAIVDIVHGQFQKAWDDLDSGLNTAGQYIKNIWGDMKNDASDTSKAISDLWGGTSASFQATIAKMVESVESADQANGPLELSLIRLAGQYSTNVINLNQYTSGLKSLTDAAKENGSISDTILSKIAGLNTQFVTGGINVQEYAKALQALLPIVNSHAGANSALIATLNTLTGQLKDGTIDIGTYSQKAADAAGITLDLGDKSGKLSTQVADLLTKFSGGKLTVQDFDTKLQGLLETSTKTFNAIPQQVAALADKYPAQFAKLDSATQAWVASMQAAAAKIPAALSTISDVKLLQNVVTSMDAVDKSTQALAKTSAAAYKEIAAGAINYDDAVLKLGTDGQTGFDKVGKSAVAQIPIIRSFASELGDTAAAIVAKYNAVQDAFSRLGTASQQSLDVTARQAKQDYQTITDAGLASTQAGTEAWLKMTLAQIASGQKLTQAQLDNYNNIAAAAKATGDASVQAFQTLGVKSTQSLQDLADKAQAAYQTIAADGNSTALDIEQAWIAATDAQIKAGDQMTLSTQLNMIAVKDAVDLATTNWISSMEKIQTAIENDLSNALGTVIFRTADVGQAFAKLGQDVVDIIVNQIIKLGIEKLISSLADANGAVGALASAFGSLGKAGGQAIGTLDKTIATGAEGAASGAASAGGAAAAGAGGSAATGLASSLATNIIGIVNGVIALGSDIFQGVQAQRTNDLLGEIEESTRYTKIGIDNPGGLTDMTGQLLTLGNNEFAWLQSVLLSTVQEVRDLMKSMVSITFTVATGGSITSLGTAIGGYLQASDTAVTDAIADGVNIQTQILSAVNAWGSSIKLSIDSGTQVVAGQIYSLNKSSNSLLSIWEKGLFGGIGGALGGATSSVGDLAGGLVGTILGAFGASQTDNLLYAVETNTRLAAITLGANGGSNSVVANTLLSAQNLTGIQGVLWQFYPLFYNSLNDIDLTLGTIQGLMRNPPGGVGTTSLLGVGSGTTGTLGTSEFTGQNNFNIQNLTIQTNARDGQTLLKDLARQLKPLARQFSYTR